PQGSLDQIGESVTSELTDILPFDRSTQKLLQRQIEEEQIAQRGVVFGRGHRAGQPLSRRRDGIGQYVRGRILPAQTEERVELLVHAPIEPAPRRGDGAIEVRARMHRLEDFQEILEFADKGILAVTIKGWLGFDRALETSQPFARDTALLKGAIKRAVIAIATQKREVRLTDDNIIGRRVVVQLLMPFLDEIAGHFLEMIAMHNVQYLIAHALSLTATSQRREHLSRPESAARCGLMSSPNAGQSHRESILGVTEFARLGVVAPLPVELADGAVAQPGKQQCQCILIVLGRAKKIVAQVEAMHQRPRAGTFLGTDDLLGQLSEFRRGQTRIARALEQRQIKILALALDPALVRLKEDEAHAARPRSLGGLRELQLQILQTIAFSKRRTRGLVIRERRAFGPAVLRRQRPFLLELPRQPPVQCQWCS